METQLLQCAPLAQNILAVKQQADFLQKPMWEKEISFAFISDLDCSETRTTAEVVHLNTVGTMWIALPNEESKNIEVPISKYLSL